MPESLVQVTSGAGPKLHTWQRTIGANNIEDEFVVPGEYPLASYFVQASGIAIANANDHALQLMAAASVYLRIRRIVVQQAASATTAITTALGVARVTTAGTGGTAVTPRPADTSDTASGTAMTLPTVKGTEGVLLFQRRFLSTQTVGTAGSQSPGWEWVQHPGMKPIIVPAGAANGIVIKSLGTFAGTTVDIGIEYVETSFNG